MILKNPVLVMIYSLSVFTVVVNNGVVGVFSYSNAYDTVKKKIKRDKKENEEYEKRGRSFCTRRESRCACRTGGSGKPNCIGTILLLVLENVGIICRCCSVIG